MIIWRKNCAVDGDLHEYIFSVMKIHYPLMIDSMCSPSMSYVIGEMATVMRQYSNGLLVFVLPEILEPLGGQLGVARGVLDIAMAEPFLKALFALVIGRQTAGRVMPARWAMREADFEVLLRLVERLSDEQRAALGRALASASGEPEAVRLIEQAFAAVPRCPHCA